MTNLLGINTTHHRADLHYRPALAAGCCVLAEACIRGDQSLHRFWAGLKAFTAAVLGGHCSIPGRGTGWSVAGCHRESHYCRLFQQ